MGVALKALLVDGLGVNQFVCYGAVGVVAIGTIQLPFPNRMPGLSQHLGANVGVAFQTSFLLTFFD